ncbi:MAG: amidohydrolase [Candidatus Bathyarchaeia archaeon]
MPEEADILIRGCPILTMDEKGVIARGFIAIKNGIITQIGAGASPPYIKAEKTIEGDGKVALPGLVNCHTHVAMTIFRGLAEDRNLEEWLEGTIWPLEAKLKPEHVYVGALLGCLEMIKSGTTCFADMYFYEGMVAEAVKKAGLRAVLSQGIIEAGNMEKGEEMLRESVEFAKNYEGYADGRVKVRLAPHTVYTCSPELLSKVQEASLKLNVGVHIHLAESLEMAKKLKEKYGLSEVELLAETGLLSPNMLAAHCIHLSRRDVELLAQHEVKVSHNPVANMKLAQGIAKVHSLLGKGVTVGLGTDGPASNNSLNMLETMKTAALLQKTAYRNPAVLPARKVLQMATVEGAKAIGLENTVGSLTEGKRADIILIDFKKPHLTPTHDFFANIVYSACGSDVDTVIVEGKILMENRTVKTVDEKKVIKKAQETAQNILAQ